VLITTCTKSDFADSDSEFEWCGNIQHKYKESGREERERDKTIYTGSSHNTGVV